MEIQSNLVDLNTAEQIELRNVPGIGSKLADRIMAARPLSDLMDLRRVSGVGPALFEQIKPYVTVAASSGPVSQAQFVAVSADPTNHPLPPLKSQANQPTPQPQSQPAAIHSKPDLSSLPLPSQAAGEETGQMQAEETVLPSGDTPPAELIPATSIPAPSDLDAVLPDQPSVPPPPPANPEPVNPVQPPNKSVTRSEMVGIAAASGVLSFILAVFFTLVFLGLINGGLRFVRPVEMNQLVSQVNTIDTQANALSGEIDNLKTRVTAVEGLDGRVTTVEQDTGQLRKDVDTLSGSAQALGKRIDDLSFQVDALITRTGRFQSFLDSLRDLLNNLNKPEVP